MNPETILQNKIIDALNRNGCHAWNHTVGMFYTKYGSRLNIGNHGEADIWGFRHSDGKMFFIEVKLPGEKPREDQYQFLSAMQKSGALSGWCTSVEGALKIMEGTKGNVQLSAETW